MFDVFRKLRRLLPRVAESSKVFERLSQTDGVSRAFYLGKYPDLKAANVDPIKHYMKFGSAEGRWPTASFDPSCYLQAYPDVRAAGIEPFYHYLMYGRTEGRVATARLERGDDDEVAFAEGREGAQFFSKYRSRRDCKCAFDVELAARDLGTLIPSCAIATERAPDVSIVIPLFGQMPFVLNCLDGVVRHSSKYSIELILVDDCSPTELGTEHLSSVPWISLLRLEANLGFLRACNAGASKARGSYIVLLNSDVRVCDGWLDELIGTFTDHPQAGLVGSKLLNSDGSLQEAGAIVWRDGSAWNYGRGGDPEASEFSFARRVDYCSGAAIAVPAQVWLRLGGFDEHFAPAYYEDVDFAFRVRESGHEVWYQPLARVIHYEGRTHGIDETHGVKAFQKVNAEKFAARWESTLRAHSRNGVAPARAANPTAHSRLLAIDALTPSPDRDAGSVMTLRLLQIFIRLGWQVSFLAAHNPNRQKHYTAALQREGIETLTAPAYGSVEDVVTARPGFFDAVLGFRVTVFADIFERLRAAYPQALILFHDIDLHYLRMEREAAIKNDRRQLREAELMRQRELGLINQVDCTIVPSTVEQSIIYSQLPLSKVVVYPYTATIRISSADFESRQHLVFVGGFQHQPNVDAVIHFVDNVWPGLATNLPATTRLYVIGPDVPKEILLRATDRIVITGYCETLDAILDECRIFVAPLRFGAGLKGKVVTALSHGVPCVATDIAIEGMGLTPDVNVVVANDALKQIHSILELYRDEDMWSHLQAAGYEFVQRNYSWETGLKIAEGILAVAEESWFARQQAARRSRLTTATRDKEPVRIQRSPSLIESTGERLVIASTETETELEHVHRYVAISQLCTGRLVLDAACGEGYGSAILSQVASRVTGIDIDTAVVEAANSKYGRPNLAFQCCSVMSLPFEENSFDVVISFETLEHVTDQETLLTEFVRVLRPDGVLVISTPNRPVYNRHLATKNPFHTLELDQDEFSRLIGGRFKNVALYGQRVRVWLTAGSRETRR